MDVNAIRVDVSRSLGQIAPEAIALYGSQIAGYAKPDSDYDALVLVRGLSGKLRYIYHREDVELSLLLVDINEAMKDAEQASMGEFVVGRLLNPYIPIYGESLIRDLEVRYKERVIREELAELFSQYGKFSYHLIIPLQYFLFSRLKKRYKIYPPALYSYAMTYSEERMDKNLSMTMPGFKQAALKVNYLVLHDDFAMIREGTEIGSLPFRDDFELFERAIKQYIFHGMSGKVGPDVVVSEAISKLKRRRAVKEVSIYLKKPEILLKLEGARLLFSGKPELELLGSSPEANRIKELGLEGSKKYFVKRFTGSKRLKWYLLGVIGRPIKPFDISPLQRMYNEYRGALELKNMGFNVPEIVAISVKKPTIIKEYIEGQTALQPVKEFLRHELDGDIVTEIGKLMRRLHDKNAVLGDSKPENFLVSKNGIYLIDLEQCGFNAGVQDKGWDIAEFLYYSLSFLSKKDRAKKFYELFFKGYGDDRSVFAEAVSVKYSLPFNLLIRADLLSYYREELSKFLGISADH